MHAMSCPYFEPKEVEICPGGYLLPECCGTCLKWDAVASKCGEEADLLWHGNLMRR